MAENTPYFGDNLKTLRDNIRDETVDLGGDYEYTLRLPPESIAASLPEAE